MKTPKIGDIVLCNRQDSSGEVRAHPAIVLFCEENSFAVQVFGEYSITIHLQYKSSIWSWPEEEKQEKCKVCNQLPVLPSYENKYCSIDCAITAQFEKECAHDYQDICLPKMPPIYQKKCMKCGDIKEEKLKECEHKYQEILISNDPALYQNRCTKCWHMDAEIISKPANKAEELIDEIYTLCKEMCPLPPRSLEFMLCFEQIMMSIKYYKGIK